MPLIGCLLQKELCVYKVYTCLALRRKSHLQVHKICVPEYFCHSVALMLYHCDTPLLELAAEFQATNSRPLGFFYTIDERTKMTFACNATTDGKTSGSGKE